MLYGNSEYVKRDPEAGLFQSEILVKARYALSSKSRWSTKDGTFDYVVAYNKVVAQFETNPEDVWVLKTLAWFNKEVFGSENGLDPNGDDSASDPDTDDKSGDETVDPLDQQAQQAKEAVEQSEDDGTNNDHHTSDDNDKEMVEQQPGPYDVEYKEEEDAMMEQWPELRAFDAEDEPQEQDTKDEDEDSGQDKPSSSRRSSSQPPIHANLPTPTVKKRQPAVIPAPRMTAQPAVVAQGNASAKQA
ncbi:hypothetical protein EWM64_g3713 [Hericium alpestre]|uniref:Uncharacterized protein n=1 Tax=Hericium alpestre TaxID=135208 RepID=A0A4Z0A352_9AGAM|nr:hypothetical protein EWM64_g3713 [Hericium alpestre]